MGAVSVRGPAAAGTACSGMRSLTNVMESQRVIRAARTASLAEAAADCVYTSTAGGQVTSHPIDRRTERRVYFNGGRYVSLERLERDRCVYCTDGQLAEWFYVYASPGLAEALAGEGLPDKLPDWRDEEDKARDHRRDMRIGFSLFHDYVDRLHTDWLTGSGYVTDEEAAAIHARIDDQVRAFGYWDDDLPAHWWRDDPRRAS